MPLTYDIIHPDILSDINQNKGAYDHCSYLFPDPCLCRSSLDNRDEANHTFTDFAATYQKIRGRCGLFKLLDFLRTKPGYICRCQHRVSVEQKEAIGHDLSKGVHQTVHRNLLISSCINIVLDYICIVYLSMGVAGAALATVSSQVLSGLLNLRWIIFKTDLLEGSEGKRKPSSYHLKQLCKTGFPLGFDSCIVGLGSVVMQSAINTLGTAVVTGQVAGEKIRQMFTIPMSSIGAGMATYAGQNEGPGATTG